MTSTFVPEPLATCAPGLLSWAFNSRGQSPCLVASNLAGSCSIGRELSQLPATWIYVGIRTEFNENVPCLCNTVYYSLESACAACQGPDHGWRRWSLWSGNCSATYQNLPVDIPQGIAIPSWAYLSVVANDGFNLDLAQAQVGPESVAPPTTTASIAPSSEPSTPVSEKKNNTGAIVGGVIGGLAIIIMLIALSVYLLRRRGRSAAQAPTFVSTLSTGTTLQPPQSPVSYGGSGNYYDGKFVKGEPQAYNPPANALGGDGQTQYVAQSLSYTNRPTSYPPAGLPSNPVIGQTYYKGIAETMS